MWCRLGIKVCIKISKGPIGDEEISSKYIQGKESNDSVISGMIMCVGTVGKWSSVVPNLDTGILNREAGFCIRVAILPFRTLTFATRIPELIDQQPPLHGPHHE